MYSKYKRMPKFITPCIGHNKNLIKIRKDLMNDKTLLY